MHIVAHSFAPRDVVAGHAALDFVNTVTARDAAPIDWLDGYARLVAWAELTGVIDAASATRLQIIAKKCPADAADALERAKRLREALHDVFAALVDGQSGAPDALRILDCAWKQAVSRAHLVFDHSLVQIDVDVASSGLDLVADVLVMSAIELLGAFPAGRARRCLGERCGWLFIDSSKGGRRVWCDMATCGNAAKSRRHVARRRRG